MPCMRRCFFLTSQFCVEETNEKLLDVSAHTVFVAVISQMKRLLHILDEDEWRRKVVYAIFQQMQFELRSFSRSLTCALIEKQFLGVHFIFFS